MAELGRWLNRNAQERQNGCRSTTSTCTCHAERTQVQHFPAYNSLLLDITRVDLSRQQVLSANLQIAEAL